jgi:flagellar hook-associated protein 3 FlgL
MQVSTRTFFRQQSENVQQLKGEILDMQNQISTGKQLSVPSEDPVSFSNLAMLKARGARISQYENNITAIRQRLSLEDSTMTQVNAILTRVRELAIQGSNDTLSKSDRKTIGLEISTLSEMLIGLANTTDADNKPLFSGAKVDRLPFERDAEGKVVYYGDSTKIEQSISDSNALTVNSTGDDVFLSVDTPDGSRKSLFDIVDSVAATLKRGDSPTAQLGDVVATLDHVTGSQTITGSRMSSVDYEYDHLMVDKLTTTSRISTLEDTDIETAVTKLKQRMTSLEAAQSAFVRITDLSLFNYLK